MQYSLLEAATPSVCSLDWQSAVHAHEALFSALKNNNLLRIETDDAVYTLRSISGVDRQQLITEIKSCAVVLILTVHILTWENFQAPVSM